MIIDPQNPVKTEIREWQKRTTQFLSVFPEFTVEAEAHSYTITMLSGEVIRVEGVAAPYTNYQRGVIRAIQETEKVGVSVEQELELLEEVAA